MASSLRHFLPLVPPARAAADSSRGFGPGLKRRLAWGFSLIELMVVMAIIGILVFLTLPMISGLTGASNFNGSLGQIAGILEQARSYATSENTYVWVAFYPVTSATMNSTGGDQLVIAVYASTDGTNPIASALGVTSTTYSVPGLVPPTTGTQCNLIYRVSSFKQLHIAMTTAGNSYTYFTQALIPSLPNATSVLGPTTMPQFQYLLNPEGITLGMQTPPGTSAPAVSMIEFTPSGSAQVGQSLADEIEIDLQPMKGMSLDVHNLAAVRVNGLTGLTTIYRN